MRYHPDLDRRRSRRLATWDYRDTGAYFVTICTHYREPLFGQFEGGDLVLNSFGWVVEQEWQSSADMRSEVSTDAFVVMPNHVHGIVWIQREPTDTPGTNVGAQGLAPLRPESLRPFEMPGRSLGSMVRGFKSAVTVRINTLRDRPGTPVWQRNYYDRIIRDDRELDRAREYILDNPRRWAEDKHNPAVFLSHGRS
jgi:REP element-mobilizing transposase RayT